jgi:hypothetical protein
MITQTERLKMSRQAPFESFVGYGSCVGRDSDSLASFAGLKCYCVKVPMNADGDCDVGGAYWGFGAPLYCVWAEDEFGRFDRVAYVRGADRAAVKAQFVGAKFYR